jgi:hypothetical protein
MEALWMDGFAESDPLQNIPSKRVVYKLLVFKELRWLVSQWLIFKLYFNYLGLSRGNVPRGSCLICVG